MSGIRQVGDGSTVVGGLTVNTPYENEKDQGVKVEDFLQLMIAQLQNQDFMNPADDTQYVTQLAQFATMQSMQELSYHSKTNYIMSLVGKNVTAATYGIGGKVISETGTVQKISLSGEEYKLTVNGKEFEMSQIMTINDESGAVTSKDIDAANKMPVIVNETTNKSIKVSWYSPISDEDLSNTLAYDVYYTTDSSIDMTTVDGIKKATKAESDIKSTSANVAGLEPGKTYFINVLVKNKNGDEAVYQVATRNTKTA